MCVCTYVLLALCVKCNDTKKPHRYLTHQESREGAAWPRREAGASAGWGGAWWLREESAGPSRLRPLRAPAAEAEAPPDEAEAAPAAASHLPPAADHGGFCVVLPWSMIDVAIS